MELKIIVLVKGGIVQEIKSSRDGIVAAVLDYDVEVPEWLEKEYEQLPNTIY